MNDKNEKIICNFCGKSSEEVETMIAGDNVHICDECIKVCYSVLENKDEKEKPSAVSPENIPYPKDIYEHLNQYIIGQEEAKRILSVAAFKHYKRISLNKEYKKENICLIGPTGCGKTYMVETLAKFLNVPFAICNATSLTEAGYVGNDVEYLLQRLIMEANYNIELAQKGIIFIDEIDKKAKKYEKSVSKDVSGEGVQQSLLRMVEGDTVKVSMPKKKGQQEQVLIDTRNILFIVGGAFVGIDTFIAERMEVNKKSMGFGVDDLNFKKAEFNDLICHVEPQDVINFGMIPEFVGRFPILVPFMELSEEQLVKIMTEPKNSLIKQYKEFFSTENVELHVEEEALKKIAFISKKRGTGARGLHSILEKILIPYEFDIEKYKNQKIVIKKEDVEKIFPRLLE